MIANILPILEGFYGILPQLIEIIIHDISRDTIVYKKGNLTERMVGDSSYLDKNENYQNVDQFIYDQVSIDGMEMRSVSIPIYEGSIITKLICINCNISIFTQMQSISNHFMNSNTQPRPEILFKNEYKEKINSWIKQQLDQNHLNLDELSSKEKKKLVWELYIKSAFEEKNAANHVASELKMGRATIFKYLKEWRKNNDQ
jgi:D-arginine utilization repressor